ncbi:uncharacterized protein PITG_06625 [Phytophthora infestans T30-4]|uniref:ZSWIM1/3 RNaseH-like domain-containing protein n=1 Tax=Phytophthora infestans (strain T30-4) TaxID=403677 RepID=D0N5A2_PHYIT|nr:uncharacterized protein PITG_06625 [Phytophthora infestans T30-4]EEY70060.1 conserved hypothetical protein [Phytophthora infestans T30-4]|eukprot:XP_002998707.1 conserved hypothetical protein [Phytophthora infestans T30-4]
MWKTRRGYATWKSWEVAFAEYCCTQRVYYRARTSKDVDEYNWATQFHKYRCKQSVFQKRRGVGKNNATVNFTGCPGFDLELMNVASAEAFEFFKSKNASRMIIRTVITDKDFVEWSVLEDCFPHAKVLLCQFHAITYWKKMVQSGLGLQT